MAIFQFHGRWQEMCVHCFFFFSKIFRIQAKANPMWSTGGVNSTPHRTNFAHAIFSRAWLKTELQAQDWVLDSMWGQQCVPLQELFVVLAHHASLALVIAGYSTFFSHPQLFPSVLLPSRGGHPPPDPRTAGLFARLVMQSPVTKTSWRPINGVSTTQWARTSWGGSSHQSTEWEESLCRTFACFATVSLWMATFGGCRWDTETATIDRRSIVTGGVQHAEANTNGERPTEYWWCAARCQCPRSERVESARSAAGAVWQPDQRTKAAGERVERWW